MKYFYLLVFTVLISGELFAQLVDGTFLTNVNYPTYEVTLAAKMQTGTGSAGIMELEFTYNSSVLDFPATPVSEVDYVVLGDFFNFPTKNFQRLSAGRIRVNIATFGTPPSVPLSTEYTSIITIYFSVTDPLGQSQLTWETTDISPGFPNPFYTPGVWLNINDTPLPVELTNFTAAVTPESNVRLNWETKTEVNNYGFDVERKKTGTEEWTKLGFVMGSGNSNSPKNYSFVDKHPVGGSKFEYRLKQMDNDGTTDYSSSVEIEVIPTKYDLTQNFPNPFNPSTRINFSVPQETDLKIVIYNMLGESLRIIAEGKYEPGFFQVELTGIDLPSGVYIYRLESKDFISAKKMMLIK